LAAILDSKLEASAELVEAWLKRLSALAMQSGFLRTQLWLISNAGFTSEASTLLGHHDAFSSSKEQFELLAGRLGYQEIAVAAGSGSDDEFVFVLPMGGDNELLAATTVEQVARRLNFTPEAINQIKTAVVEACINASEHSLSPERKIYQRFRVEDDKLVITISSRGILPANISAGPLNEDDRGAERGADERRGWGLKLIRTLMDEVEFERVDEGTSLRMTKYLRQNPPATA
jgi:serine/threonine-protein kinase RsbW